jgi:DnaJ-class molecular chaperone
MHQEAATVFRRTRPRRSYKNFGLFCLAHGSTFGHPCPCLACRGQGTVYDPEDPPCPVEGDKCRRTIRCTACGGSGRGSKEACRQAYRQTLEAYRQEKAEYDRLAGLRRQALKRLTEAENAALRELGL